MYSVLICIVKLISKLIIFIFRIPKLSIVTGTDSSHFYSQMQLLNSIRLTIGSTNDVTVYDLGISTAEREKMLNTFPDITLIRFPYENYPDYFNIKINAGEYAWKPVIIHKELTSKQQSLIWLDAGCFLIDTLWYYRIWIWLCGFYSPFAAGYIREWTHPLTIERMNMSSDVTANRNLCGGIIAVNHRSEKATSLITKWKNLALDKSIIAPEGSDRTNHRQDQSILSLLFYSSFGNIPLYGKGHGVKVNADIDI